MKRLSLALLLVMLALPAQAALPDEVLDKDYQACMGGDHDPQRGAYCNCIRDQMRGWDDATYEALAKQEANAANGAPMPEQISELAKICFAKVLH